MSGDRAKNSRPYLVLNVSYVKSIQGIIKCVQLFLGLLCLGLILYYCTRDRFGVAEYQGFKGSLSETYFFLVTFSCLHGTATLLISYVISLSTATVLPKTTTELIYHGFASVFYLTSSLALMITIIQRNSKLVLYRERGYAGLITASVFGLINTGLYVTSFMYSYIMFKGT
ncbi:uncharacterized protein LOC111613083 [Centruroides sculpturatus]|uniref:uncharacterized protein LOC111613083 n=1 Tax=Centruroides sculpturatus TaxID=218467 RepID=UPI000C6E6283|nr:uncharacterized protein LOC111613083 [Centruroides sculpturatus]